MSFSFNTRFFAFSIIIALSTQLTRVHATPMPSLAGRAEFTKQNGLDAQKLNAQFATLKAGAACDAATMAMACADGGFAQCVGDKWAVSSCGGGLGCFALPLVNKPGTSITCDSETDAISRIEASGVTGGLTGTGSDSGAGSGAGSASSAAESASASATEIDSKIPSASATTSIVATATPTDSATDSEVATITDISTADESTVSASATATSSAEEDIPSSSVSVSDDEIATATATATGTASPTATATGTTGGEAEGTDVSVEVIEAITDVYAGAAEATATAA